MSAGRHLEAREAELAVLGAILLDNMAIDRVAELLSADDFYMPRHRTIFARMMSSSKPISPSIPSPSRRPLSETMSSRVSGGWNIF